MKKPVERAIMGIQRPDLTCVAIGCTVAMTVYTAIVLLSFLDGTFTVRVIPQINPVFGKWRPRAPLFMNLMISLIIGLFVHIILRHFPLS